MHNAILPHGGRRPSKHSAKPGKGAVRIRDNSSLRKLMRAANRGKIPAERLRVILQTMQNALMLDRRDAHATRHYDHDRSRVVRAS